jgi:hypothetical protein
MSVTLLRGTVQHKSVPKSLSFTMILHWCKNTLEAISSAQIWYSTENTLTDKVVLDSSSEYILQSSKTRPELLMFWFVGPALSAEFLPSLVPSTSALIFRSTSLGNPSRVLWTNRVYECKVHP